MADDKKKDDAAAAGAAKPSKILAILGIVVPGLLAGGASFGGGLVGAQSAVITVQPAEEVAKEGALPGPTVRMNPFVLNLSDAKNNAHALKISLAVELKSGAAEADFQTFIPRIRDSTITLLRRLSFEDATKPDVQDTLRKELLVRIHELGAEKAAQVWVTDFVVQ